jgi:hypothetical protein
MKISLTEETAARIRDVLGNDVDLAPDVVPGVLARLAVEAPAVYSQVLEELSGSQIRLDSERELRRRRRRGLLRRLLFSWGEYETDVGDRLLEKRHIAAALPVALAVLTTVLLGFTLFAGRRVLPPPGPYPVVARNPVRENLHQGVRSPSPVLPGLIPAPREAFRASRPSTARSFGQSPITATLPVPALPPGLPGFPDPSGITGRGLGSPIVVNLQPSASNEAVRPADPVRTLSPLVYNRDTDLEAQRREGAAAATDPAASARGPAGGNTSAPPVSLVAGSRVSGTLLTGALVVPGGPPAPVLVETADPHGVWVGQAVAGPGDRVQMTLTLTTQRRGEAVRAVVLDPAGLFPGLPGRTTIRHASAAAALAAAALQATADYTTAVARQGSVSVGGPWGPIVLGGQAPEPWTYLAARLAQDFQARSSQGGWVTMIEIPAGTPLVILIMGAS